MTEFGDALIDNPILNSPYFEPARHWAFDEECGTIFEGPVDAREPSLPLAPRTDAKHLRRTPPISLKRRTASKGTPWP